MEEDGEASVKNPLLSFISLERPFILSPPASVNPRLETYDYSQKTRYLALQNLGMKESAVLTQSGHLLYEDPRKLPDRSTTKTLTLVLDLDETMIHVIRPYHNETGSFVLRPGLIDFLEYCQTQEVEIIIWTAGTLDHVGVCVQLLDPLNKLIDYIIYNNNNNEKWKVWPYPEKDLGILADDQRVASALLIDDMVAACFKNGPASIIITKFDPADQTRSVDDKIFYYLGDIVGRARYLQALAREKTPDLFKREMLALESEYFSTTPLPAFMDLRHHKRINLALTNTTDIARFIITHPFIVLHHLPTRSNLMPSLFSTSRETVLVEAQIQEYEYRVSDSCWLINIEQVESIETEDSPPKPIPEEEESPIVVI